MKLLALMMIAAGLAAAQTAEHTFTLTQYGSCGDPNSSACWEIYLGTIPMPYVSSTLNDQGTGTPSVKATWAPEFTSCFSPSIPVTFHTGSIVPTIPTPQVGTCSGLFNWSDGAANSGTVMLLITCRFDISVYPYEYATSCNGSDGAGTSTTLIHKLGLVGPHRWGYWGWADHHGTMDFTIEY